MDPWTPLTLTNPPSPQVIAADGEQKAARALKEASETIAESSSAMQLRYLQVRLDCLEQGLCSKDLPGQHSILSMLGIIYCESDSNRWAQELYCV